MPGQLLPEFDSVLFDSPLNKTGFAQAKALARVIEVYPKGREDVTKQLDDDIAALRGTVLHMRLLLLHSLGAVTYSDVCSKVIRRGRRL